MSRPAYTAQLTALRGVSENAGELATALEAGQSAHIPVLLRGFDAAAARPASVGVQQATIAAARAYDRQNTELVGLATQAEQERSRLARSLS